MPRRKSSRRRAAYQAAAARPAPSRASWRLGLPSRFPTLNEAWPPTLLALLVVVFYLPAMIWGGFVWDDISHIPGEPAIRDWSGIFRIWFQPSEVQEPFYRPLTYTSFWLEHKLWGFNPSGFHTVNVLLHLANTLLLWRVLLRLTVPGSFLIAAVFAVHPVHVESVAWAIERKDMLSGLFYLSAALAWLHFQERPHRLTYGLTLVLFAAGLLAKNMVVTLPAALLILQWYHHGRLTRRDLLLAAPFFAVAVCFVALDLALVTSATPAEFHYTIAERVSIAGRAIWFYAGKLLWPLDLVIIYPHWDATLGSPLEWGRSTTAAAWALVAALPAIAAALWVLRGRTGRGLLAGLLFFVVTLSPALGFVDHTYMLFSFVADRYQYLASIGVIAIVIGAAAYAVPRFPRIPIRAAMVLAGATLLILGTLTWQQSRVYSDQLTFFEHVTERSPTAVGAHLNLANALLDAGRLEDARAAGRIAVEQRPGNFDAYGNLVQILIADGDTDAALELAREAAERFPGEARAPAHVGLALVHAGHADDAVAEFERAVGLDPDYADARLGLGVALITQERHQDALEHLRVAVDVAPENPQGWANLGIALLGSGRHQDALKAFDRSLTINPQDESALAGRGVALQRIREGAGG